MTQIWAKGESFKDDQYILATQVKQVFYLEDMARRPPNWKVVEHVNHKKFSNGGVIVVEDDPDVIHFDNSSDLALSTSLNDLDFATLHIDGQSTDVDEPPNIIDVDEDDDIIDDEDALTHDLADSNNEDLVNVDDDDDDVAMSADVARGHGGDGGGDDCPPSHLVPTSCGGCLGNRGKGTRKPNLGGRKAGRLHTYQETQNLRCYGVDDESTLLVPGHGERKEGGHGKDWGVSYFMILAHLQKAYKLATNSASRYKQWVQRPQGRDLRDMESIRLRMSLRTFPRQISMRRLPFGMIQEPFRDQMMESFASREYPSLIQTFFQTQTVGGVFLSDEDRALYAPTPRRGVPYTEDEIMAIIQKGKQRGHLPSVGRVLPGHGTNVFSPPLPPCTHISDFVKLKKSNKMLTKQVNMIMKLFRSDDKMSQMLRQLESQPEFGSGSGSGGCGDDESGDDEDGNEDEEDDEDVDS
ncbi:hypothetical protein Tco_0895733 [Tanacetum coccineum]|uniref:DUF4216 domain-containing protein n=1 Tax=Tanacetum coccineum TaxID=301880 RepID=A0ABQ5CFF2_9ASTR